MSYARKFAPSANEISLKHEELTVAGISQMYMDCPSEEGKYDILVKLYGMMTIGSSIIFVKVCTDKRVLARVLLTTLSVETQPQESSKR